ncbi:RNA polymerase sigma factor [Denitrobaculum tricleocarpae]|uniref:RNA polymerase sigma factor n=1 Tax=Denitrobaculum tricleocarpae TaxID=2591009 RepID=A0A545TF87_9PROT|nr:RNA polymerase sigma factor [Denitrobaculum tricleocarpae]TQV75893.1 RNA polymerase sigma factor [Denitrobaculum tricleocarpae]
MDSVAAIVRSDSKRALATLIRILGDIELAEDSLQEAVAQALEHWPRAGRPDNPLAWLITTARNKAIDRQRRRVLERRYSESQQDLHELPSAGLHAEEGMEEAVLGLHIQDDLLRLIFTCCHPALARPVQTALTLKTIAGLSVAEIASGFLVPVKTMEQRLIRAKRKIAEARIPYEVPRPADLPERLGAVLSVVYLIFNEGYASSGAGDLIRVDLCKEAIRLARMLVRLFRGEPEVSGLLALLLLQHSRHRARTDAQGQFVTLDQQDRGLWDSGMIAEGRSLVEKALHQKKPGPYQIQAAIAALHCAARDAEKTDWPQIAELYAALEHRQPSPVVTLNRAAAVSKARGPEAGLALLATIEDLPDMQRYHYFHSVLGALLAECGRASEAIAAFQQALLLTRNPSERAYLQSKVTALLGQDKAG